RSGTSRSASCPFPPNRQQPAHPYHLRVSLTCEQPSPAEANEGSSQREPAYVRQSHRHPDARLCAVPPPPGGHRPEKRGGRLLSFFQFHSSRYGKGSLLVDFKCAALKITQVLPAEDFFRSVPASLLPFDQNNT